MNHKEFQEYMAFMLPDYARDIAEHYLLTIEKANEDAKQQLESLLPEQEKSKDTICTSSKKITKLQAIFGFM
jgi:hypothetical protein